MTGRNGRNGEKQSTKRGVTAKPSKARLAALDRLIREGERRTGVKVPQADVDAVLAELAAAR
jgi:hypothetical protein